MDLDHRVAAMTRSGLSNAAIAAIFDIPVEDVVRIRRGQTDGVGLPADEGPLGHVIYAGAFESDDPIRFGPYVEPVPLQGGALGAVRLGRELRLGGAIQMTWKDSPSAYGDGYASQPIVLLPDEWLPTDGNAPGSAVRFEAAIYRDGNFMATTQVSTYVARSSGDYLGGLWSYRLKPIFQEDGTVLDPLDTDVLQIYLAFGGSLLLTPDATS